MTAGRFLLYFKELWKFGGIVVLILKTILHFSEIFSADKKSAILDFVRSFSFYEHMFEDFRMPKKSQNFAPKFELSIEVSI